MFNRIIYNTIFVYNIYFIIVKMKNYHHHYYKHEVEVKVRQLDGTKREYEPMKKNNSNKLRFTFPGLGIALSVVTMIMKKRGWMFGWTIINGVP